MYSWSDKLDLSMGGLVLPKYTLGWLLLILKAPPEICSRRHTPITLLLQESKYGLILHVNRLQADDSHEISNHILPEN